MNIRYRVDAYDEQRLFKNERSGPGADASVSHSHVWLGWLDNIVRLGLYAKKLSKDICLQDLQRLLTTFLHHNHVFNTRDVATAELKAGVMCTCQKSAHVHIGGSLSRVAGHV